MATRTTTTLARSLTRRTNTAFQRTTLLPLSLGLTTAGGLITLHHQKPMKFDSTAAAAASADPFQQQQSRSYGSGQSPKRKDTLDAETIKQLSGGSLSGFFAGLLVSVFSKTLVLLAGIGMVVIQVAARNGIDLAHYLKLKERASTSRILAALNQHTAFKLSFAIAFALSAFMSF